VSERGSERGSERERTVLTYGTFDLLHYGHIRLLTRARAMGDRLVVGLSTDDFNSVKGKHSFFTYEQRREVLESLAIVDEVFPEECWEQKHGDIARLRADVLVMGDDWEGRFDALLESCEVAYLPYTNGISSSRVKEYIVAWGETLPEDE